MKRRVFPVIMALLTLFGSRSFALSSYPAGLEKATGTQAIVVTLKSGKKYQATMTLYEKKANGWITVSGPIPAVVGRNGVISADRKKEGDGCTPAGLYSLGTGFGWYDRLSKMTWPWKKVSKQDYWIDDITSADYNKWVTTAGNPDSFYKSFEKLRISAYKYALVINYNTDPVLPGKGSAIFLHVWISAYKGTSGCIAVSQGNIKAVLRWLKPESKPMVLILETA